MSGMLLQPLPLEIGVQMIQNGLQQIPRQEPYIVELTYDMVFLSAGCCWQLVICVTIDNEAFCVDIKMTV